MVMHTVHGNLKKYKERNRVMKQIIIRVEDQDQVDVIQDVLEDAENDGTLDFSFDFMIDE